MGKNSEILEEILEQLKDINEALKPKVHEVTVSPVTISSDLDPEVLAERLKSREADWRKLEGYPEEDNEYKTVSEVKEGDEVSLDGQIWETVGRTLRLAHGAVWLYNENGMGIARLPENEEIRVRLSE
jgi:hypothetical protein